MKFYNLSVTCRIEMGQASPKPKESFLVVQKEAAMKYTGKPLETQFSIFAKPFYRLRVVRQLRRTDFYPVPKVDSVSLHIEKRRCPLIEPRDAKSFQEFACQGFGGHKKNLRLNFGDQFTCRQWKRLAEDLGVHLNAKPSEIHINQWIKLFDFYKRT